MCWSHGAIVVYVHAIYNTKCELNSVIPMSNSEFRSHLVIMNLEPQKLVGWYNLAGAELLQGVF